MPSKPRSLMVWLLAACSLSAQTRPAPAKSKAPSKDELYDLRGRVLAIGVDVPVVGVRLTFANNRPQFETSTDSKGEFNALLPAGDYTYNVKLDDDVLVEGARLTIAAGKKPAVLTIRIPRAATITGVVEDADGNGVAGVRVEASNTLTTSAPKVSATTGSNGKFTIASVFPGSYVIRAAMVRTSSNDVSPFVTTYFPGTTDSFAAEEITLSGEDLPNLRLRMQQPGLHWISGAVTGREKNPNAAKTVTLRPFEDPRARGGLYTSLRLGSTIDADGAFSIDNVPPGRYTAFVEGNSGLPSAAVEITVRDRDIEDLRIDVAPGGVLAGTVIGENGKLPKDWGYTFLGGQTAAGNVRSRLTIKKDGSFSLDGVSAGTYGLALEAQSGFSVKSVEIGGRKYEGSKFPFTVPGPSNVVITVGEGGALIQGTLAGSRKPDEFVTGTVTVVMMSGFADGLTYLRKANLMRNGSFTFIDLEVGIYLVCAWTDYSARTERLLTLGEPPVERLRQLCKTVELKAGGFESVELRQTSLFEVNAR